MSLRDRFNRWYDGTSEQEQVFGTRVNVRVHWSARIARRAWKFWCKEWRLLVPVALTVAGLLLAWKKL
jgi:hypothetical protein